MKVRLKKMLFTILMIVVSIIFFSCSFNSLENKIVVTVNDEAIYEYQIQNVLNQSLEKPIDRDFLIENSINELVVVQFGQKNGIKIEDDLFQEYISNYKKQYPDYFQKGIDIYGVDEFYKGLKYHLIFQQTKDKIIKEEISETNATDNDLKSYLKTKEYDIILSDENYNLIKEKYIKETQEILFKEWVEKQRKDCSIFYY